jgi:hypothetical protein
MKSMRNYFGHSIQNDKIDHWQRSVLAFYAGLFGLILPFICWGAHAEPNHAHIHAHFVFAKPVVRPAQPAVSHNQHHSTHQPAHHAETASSPSDTSFSFYEPQALDFSGAAKPSLLVLASIMLVILSAWTLQTIFPTSHIRRYLFQPAQSHLARVPTPPPRAIAC